jgi:hypothetical protein
MDVLAGTEFFTVEVLTWRGLVTYYVLFFRHLETRRVSMAGITGHPTEEWMTQMARMQWTRNRDICAAIAMYDTTAMPSSALISEKRWQPEV